MQKKLTLLLSVLSLIGTSFSFADNTVAAPAAPAETKSAPMVNGPSVNQTGDAPVGKDKDAKAAKKKSKKKGGKKKKAADDAATSTAPAAASPSK